ncbi:uncharacterized protein EV420DRAFT_1002452 [Desarmillaria tabescens]|uniref:F-box domain-containing protein n=1 Tax=Armillaria tabescens TaxID=1929756 RepID=A0AA39JNH0_ARMTA|nr:uncharacterized protein EV420DRAFT_1002452 [Desarmillaria tabescens]KAK0444549.1 hypothetical protein EV420DRAFT_1002452 [Desarmillaria tabescens]
MLIMILLDPSSPISIMLLSDIVQPLVSRLKGSKRSRLIHALPPEILLEHIFPLLPLHNLLALRSVDKRFFYITHDFVVWRRMFKRSHLPLPLIHPPFQYTPARDHHVERAFIRACSLEKNWRIEPCILKAYILETPGDKVLEVALLPGGKYLVASMADVKNYQYYLAVFDADETPETRNNLLAKIILPSRAYQLRARFMHYQGEQRIIVFYVRRGFPSGALYSQDPSTLSYDVNDLEHPLSYDCVCTSVALGSLAYLSDPDKDNTSTSFREHAKSLPSPFQWNSTVCFGEIRPERSYLCQYLGAPCAAVCHRNRVVVINFNTQRTTHIICPDIGPNPRMLALRMLPDQAHILVVRADAHGGSIELYPIPQVSVQHTTFPLQQRITRLSTSGIDAAYISDMYMPKNANGTPWTNSPPCITPPISIYLTHFDGVIGTFNLQLHQNIKTESMEYNLYEGTTLRTVRIPPAGRPNVLPGAYRPVVYYTDWFDRTEAPKISSWWRGYNRANMDYAEGLFKAPQATHYPPREWEALYSLTQNYLKEELENGAQSLSWDEGSGRMCISSL